MKQNYLRRVGRYCLVGRLSWIGRSCALFCAQDKTIMHRTKRQIQRLWHFPINVSACVGCSLFIHSTFRTHRHTRTSDTVWGVKKGCLQPIQFDQNGNSSTYVKVASAFDFHTLFHLSKTVRTEHIWSLAIASKCSSALPVCAFDISILISFFFPLHNRRTDIFIYQNRVGYALT